MCRLSWKKKHPKRNVLSCRYFRRVLYKNLPPGCVSLRKLATIADRIVQSPYGRYHGHVSVVFRVVFCLSLFLWCILRVSDSSFSAH